jgi:hypothetical protein
MRRPLVSGIACLAVSVCPVFARDAEALEQSVNVPTASVMSFQFQNFHPPNFHNTPADRSFLQFGAAVPNELGSISNIVRLILSYITEVPGGENGFRAITLFPQNLLSAGAENAQPDVNLSTLQPFVNASLGISWFLGISVMTFVYCRENGDFTSVPQGAQLSKLVKTGGLPVQCFLSCERNLYDSGNSPKETIVVSAKLLVPG